jgi:predicted HTH transcriptional regulator
MYPYNPFIAQIRDLDLSHLRQLRGIPEGWYVEYKREFPKVESAAKSVCAFANTFGGWLFYGIQEDKGTKTAGAFPGIADEDISQIEQQLQQAASCGVNPSPYFDHKVPTRNWDFRTKER